jgi:hypothetical protein
LLLFLLFNQAFLFFLVIQLSKISEGCFYPAASSDESAAECSNCRNLRKTKTILLPIHSVRARGPKGLLMRSVFPLTIIVKTIMMLSICSIAGQEEEENADAGLSIIKTVGFCFPFSL